MTIWNDEHTFKQPVTFSAEVTFSETPVEISLDSLSSLTGSGTCTFADLVATDDLTVGDDATIGGDLAVTGNVSAADLAASDDLTVGDDASIGGDLAVTGTATVGGLAATGTVDLSSATITLPSTSKFVTEWFSQEISVSDLAAGATQSINLTSPPTNARILACHVTTAPGDTVSSSTGDTTGLTCEVGVAADPDLLMQSVSLFGAVGLKGGLPGIAVGGLRTADTLQLKLTATGGSADLVDILGLACQVVILYVAA